MIINNYNKRPPASFSGKTNHGSSILELNCAANDIQDVLTELECICARHGDIFSSARNQFIW